MLEYTSPEISNELVAASSVSSPRKVVDFCAGQGSLLKAAQSVWPGASFFAVDIDPGVIGSLPSVFWFCGDFLDSSFDQNSESKLPHKFDLILLNPPFSFDRTQVHFSRGINSDLKCSVAFAFLFTTLEYLESEGELLAIMPTSSLQSDRDAASRKRLGEAYECKIVSPPSYDRFPGLDVSTYLLSVKRKSVSKRLIASHPENNAYQAGWNVIRGRMSVRRSEREVQDGLHGWIHTTSIRSSRVVERYRLPNGVMARHQTFLPKGSLIVPRVGRIKFGHLAITKRREILSDCLLGVSFDDPYTAIKILNHIKINFPNFLAIYAGTGAPYTTQHKVMRYLADAQLKLAGIRCEPVAE